MTRNSVFTLLYVRPSARQFILVRRPLARPSLVGGRLLVPFLVRVRDRCHRHGGAEPSEQMTVDPGGTTIVVCAGGRLKPL